MADGLLQSDSSTPGERYSKKVKVWCGDKEGFFIGGHWDRKHKQRCEVWILCCCGCNRRLLCREFEVHAGRQAAKSWQTSIKISDRSAPNLGEWIKQQCQKLGHGVVGQQLSVWQPSRLPGSPGQEKVGVVSSYNVAEREHFIFYQDQSQEVLYLAVEAYKLASQADGHKQQHDKSPREDDASSISAPHRQGSSNLHSQVWKAKSDNIYTAASALVGMSNVTSNDQQATKTHRDSGLPSTATLYADPAKGMRVWQSKNFLHGSLSASEKHEKVREVLLDLFPLDNRLLPMYLGKCWGGSVEPYDFICKLFNYCERNLTMSANRTEDQVQASLLQLFRGALGLASC